jgi:hypothetical protein
MVPTPVLVKKAGMPAPPARSFLGQRALGCELQLQFAGQVLALELLVLAHVAGNHLLDLARLEQLAQAETVDTGVVGDDGQVFDAAVAQRVDQRFGNAAQAEAADASNWPSLTMPSAPRRRWG